MLLRSTRTSNLTARTSHRYDSEASPSSGSTGQRTKDEPGAPYVLSRCSTWLIKGVVNVEIAIRAFWNSTTLTRLRKRKTSVRSSETVTAGPPKYSEKKSENAGSFVPTATRSIPLPKENITPTTTSDPHLRRFMRSTPSKERIVEIVDGIRDNTIDYDTVSMQEWLQISFLMLFDGDEVHMELPIIYGGSTYHLHACVEQVVPPGGATPYRNKI